MSTYLQGVTDYIPQIQPFQPDLNFYNTLLSTKQTQYDTNWKALNKMYSQYYNADLTREGNINKRDNFMKQAEFNLQRISQLDLSLEKNIDQATQIFKPFYEDKSLMKDMAWTKNHTRQLNIANSLKGSSNKDDRDMYWDTGVTAMNYKKEEFKNASEEEALNFENVEYTRYVNVNKEAMKLAKESGLSITTPEPLTRGDDWIITTTNGERLIEPLSKLFESQLGSDPAIQAVYKTQAYVDRKNYAASNAAQFKNGESEAEMKYLETQFNTLKEENTRRLQTLKENSNSYDAKIADLKKQIENKTASPSAVQDLKVYQMNKDINEKILKRVADEQDELDGGSSKTATTSTGFVNPYGDIKSLRWKVDNAWASKLMQKDLNEAAEEFAYRNYKQEIKANPYKVKEIDHSYRMSEIAARNAGLERAAALRNKGDAKNNRDKFLVETLKTHEYDENANAVPIESLHTVYDTPTTGGGGTTDEQNQKVRSKNASKMYTNDLAMPYLNTMIKVLGNLKSTGKISDSELKRIIKYNDKTNVDWKHFTELMKSNPDEYIRNKIGIKGLKEIKKRFDQYVLDNPNLSNFDAVNSEYKNLVSTGVKLDDYYMFVELDQNWRKESSKVIIHEVEKFLPEELKKYAKYLYNEKGNFVSDKEFYSKIPENIKSKYKISGATYVGGSPLTMGTTGETIRQGPDSYREELDYKKLQQIAAKAYSNSNLGIKAPPAYNGEGTGLSTLGNAKTINVNLQGHTPNKYRWQEIKNDLLKFDFGDNTKNHVSLEGVNERAYENIRGGKNRLDIGRAVFEAFKREESNPMKNKLGNFEVQVLPVTVGKSNQAAIIIKPSLEWISANTATIDKETKAVIKPGIFTPSQAEAAAKNGISYMMPQSNMTNSIYKSYFNDPIAMYLNSGEDKVYTKTYPTDPRYKIEITKDYLGQEGYYNLNGTYVQYENGKEVIKDFSTGGLLGNNLMTTRDQLLYDLFPQIQQGIITDFNSNSFGE